MGSALDDRTASARIRDVAMERFAERGPAEVTVREIAEAAGVSPALVMHHYSSKEGLREAVDERVVAFVDELIAELADRAATAPSDSLGELFAERMEREPALAAYLGRLLVDSGPAGDALFGRLFESTRAGLDHLRAAGAVRPSRDDAVLAAFLLVNDLALVLLRDRIRQVIGDDPLSRRGMSRWAATVVDAYRSGVFDLPAEVPAPGPPPPGGDHVRRP